MTMNAKVSLTALTGRPGDGTPPTPLPKVRLGKGKGFGPSSASGKYKLGNIIVSIVLALGSVVMLAPLVWTLSTSLKTRDGVFALPPQWIPDPFVWDNYIRVWTAGPLLSGIKNSLIVAGSVTIVGTIFSALAAYAFAKLRVPGRNVFFLLLLSGLMIPYPTLMIPQFIMFSGWGRVNALWPLIVPGMFGNIMMIFFLRQYLSSIPDTTLEAAKIDGAGFLQVFGRLIVPLIEPAIAAQFILWFMAIWNDYLAPIIYLNSPETQTLQLVIASFNATYAIQTDYPLIMTASIISLIPVLTIFLIFQRQIIESIALTGSK